MRTHLFVLPLALLLETVAQASTDRTDLFDIALEDLNNIVVVARRREEPLRLVPASITVRSGHQIHDASVTSTQHVDEFAPNVRFDTTAVPNTSRIFIRGLGQRSIGFRSDPRVGLYLNDVHIPRAVGGVFDLLDIESVQILRGTQGTLFGKNTTGGAILIHTKAPEEKFAASVRVGAGADGLLTTSGVVNLPLIENRLSTRIAVATQRYDGYQEDALTGTRYFDQDTLSLHGSVLALLANDLTLRIDLNHFAVDETGESTNCVWKPAPGSLAGLAAIFDPGLYDQWRTGCNTSTALGADKVLTSPRTATEQLLIQGLSSTLTWQLGKLSIKSITGYRSTSNKSGQFDFDGQPALLFDFIHDHRDKARVFSQELQIAGTYDRVDWIGGLYFSDEKGRSDGVTNCAAVGLILPDFNGDGAADFSGTCLNSAPTEDRVRSLAIYGETTWHLNDHYDLTVGLRFTQDRKRARDQTGGLPLTRNENFQAFTPRVNLAYRANENTMLYASWSKGYTSGGFNSPETGLQPYDEEFINTYEVGAKSSAWDDRLQLSAAVFWSKLEEQQVLVNSVANNGSVTFLFENAAASTIRGAELEVIGSPWDRLRLSFGLGYLDTQFDEFSDLVQSGTTPGGAPVFTTRDRSRLSFHHAPKLNMNASAAYVSPLPYGQIETQVDWNYEAKVYNDPDNTREAVSRSRHLFNARISYLLPNANTQLSLWGRNLTDEIYLMEGGPFNPFDFVFVQYAPRRTWGVELRHTFGVE